MNAPKLFALAMSVWICISSAHADVMCAFSGTCRNATGGVDGNVKLIFSVADNKIEGQMSVSGWLVGGGSVKGTREGNNYRFKTIDSIWGQEIEWEGTMQNNTLSGEYIVSQKAGTPRQVGEWQVEGKVYAQVGSPQLDKMTVEMMKLGLEHVLNAPVKQSDGKVIRGADNIFKAVHPAGSGVSVYVESLDIDWKPESRTRELRDIYKYRATYILYWQGIVTPAGVTRLRLAYNAKIDAITSHEIIESTGTTNKQFGEMAFSIGALLGKAAVDSMFDGK